MLYCALHRFPNLKSVRELILKRGQAKINNKIVPLTDNTVIEEHLGECCCCDVRPGCVLGLYSPLCHVSTGLMVNKEITPFISQGDLVSFAWKTSSMKLPFRGSISGRSLHSCAHSTSLWPVMLPRTEWGSSRRWALLAVGVNASISSSAS